MSITPTWIWPAPAGDAINQFAEFRHEFTLDEAPPGEAWLTIAADSHYAAWINGQFAGAGQYTGYPQHAYSNRYAVGGLLRAGRNVLAVSAQYCGCDHFSYIPSGQPGVIYALELAPDAAGGAAGRGLCHSGMPEGRLARLSPSYRPGPLPRITGQLPFTFEFDAAGEDGWRALDYHPSADWSAAFTVQPARRLSPLPIAHWQVFERQPAAIVAQGTLRLARAAPGGDDSVAARMQADFLSSRTPRQVFEQTGEAPLKLGQGLAGDGLRLRPEAAEGADGVYLVIDLGRECAGFQELELSAAAGLQVDIAYGQHLNGLRVRAEVGGRHFASCYRCRQGRQAFTHWAVRAGGRYLQLHLHGDLRGFALYYAGLRPALWPVELRGAFHSPDRLDRRIFEVGARTLHLCMHEHYEDTPWREQGLYANDSLIQALCGYYAFGEYAFPAFSFHLLGESLKPDGWLELCAPARIPITIPSFSLAWVLACEQHWRYSADRPAAEAVWPVVARLLDGWRAQIQEGLLPSPQGARYWHFYDWMGGLDGCTEDGAAFAVLTERRFDAALNAYFILALQSGASLAEGLGSPAQAAAWRQTADELRPAFQRRFWLPEQELYAAFAGLGTPPVLSELVQALALCAGVSVDEAQNARLRGRLLAAENGLIPSTLSQSLYTLQALAPDPQRRTPMLELIRQVWGEMLLQGATSFWETRKGGWDFDEAGSLCHGWSTLPLYAFGAWLLGVRPLEPGFRAFSLDPDLQLAAGCSGRIPTPHGPISIAWQRSAEGELVAQLTCPPGLRPVPSPAVKGIAG